MGQFDGALTSEAFNQNPYPLYHAMRRQAPIYWSDAWGCWLLTRYEDITWTLQDYQTFTSLGRLTASMELPEPLWERGGALGAPLFAGADQCRSAGSYENAEASAYGFHTRAPSARCGLTSRASSNG